MIIRTYSDILGYTGTALILASYLALAAHFIGPTWYCGLGIASSLMMFIHGLERQTRPIVLLNAVWFILSVMGLIRAAL